MFTLPDFPKLISRLLPPFLRGARMKAWLRSLLRPLQDVWSDFLAFRLAVLDALSTAVTSESLQAKLRVMYPATGGHEVWVRTLADEMPSDYEQWLGEHHAPGYDYFLSENTNQVDYFQSERQLAVQYAVYIPTAYNSTATLGAVTTFLNRFRPAGRQFQIIFQDL